MPPTEEKKVCPGCHHPAAIIVTSAGLCGPCDDKQTEQFG